MRRLCVCIGVVVVPAVLQIVALTEIVRAENTRRGETVVLMLDRESVESAEGVTFHLNPAVKHEENPVLIPGMPHEWDSLQVNWPSCILYDPVEEKFL